ncbi:Alpha/Beta hydrolase protein [Mycena alexandri]|uniref:Dipeptidyl-peptidase V n=1 Tax=Mycena alexandri TaxID=1745969 RepID=A0AAD6X8X7_9AGAR|nr:Alpha/Beta hydrolase protein [Mycena alexandri]
MPIVVERIAIAGENPVPSPVATYQRSPAGQSLWLASGHIADFQSCVPTNTLDARALLGNRPGATNVEGEGFIAVEVCNDVDTHMDVVVCSADGSVHTTVQMFQTEDDVVWFSARDAKRIVDASGEVSYIFAAILSSAIRHEPLNAWTICVDSKGALKARVKLSSHLEWLADAPRLRTEAVHWKTGDGTRPSGLVEKYIAPRENSKLIFKGGCYQIICHTFGTGASSSPGYLVISPNYRGSRGRGHEFAHAANLGGPLAAWGATKSKTRFKVAILGAGTTNWESQVMAALEQSTPWDHDAPEGSERKTSPVHSVAGVTTAILIIHGDKDDRVPVGQAIGFWRGLKRRAELVVSPREAHE